MTKEVGNGHDEYEFEKTIEHNIYKNMISNVFVKNLLFLKQFKLKWKEKRHVPSNISWTDMKENYDWGFLKGSHLSPILTWIYLRPDIACAIRQKYIRIKILFKHGVLNQHYFLVKQNAIQYIKLHCIKLVSPVSYILEDELKESPQRKISKLIDDEAIEEK